MSKAEKLEYWLVGTLKDSLKIEVVNVPRDGLKKPNIIISEVHFEPWLIKPVSEKISFLMTVNSNETSNQEVIKISREVRVILSQYKPSYVIKCEIEEIECYQVDQNWKSEIEVIYYTIEGVIDE